MDNKIKENQEVTRDSLGIAGRLDIAGQLESGAKAPRNELLESLSAMMDDEAESLETRRIVKSLGSSPESSESNELLGHWRRYHAVRASLQHEIHTAPAVDLLTAVRTGLADEAAFNDRTSGIFRKSLRSGGLRTGGIFRIAGQGLIAATVAAAVLVTYPMLTLTQNGAIPGGSAPALVADQQVPARDTLPQMNGDYSASPLTRTVSLDDAARHRLETAVRNFSGTTAVLNSNNSAMFVNQLEPFATNSPAVSPTASPTVAPAKEQPAQRR